MATDFSGFAEFYKSKLRTRMIPKQPGGLQPFWETVAMRESVIA